MAARKPFLLRMDPALREDLEVWARDELRSLNGQIEYILKQAVRQRRRDRSEREAPSDPPASSSGDAS